MSKWVYIDGPPSNLLPIPMLNFPTRPTEKVCVYHPGPVHEVESRRYRHIGRCTLVIIYIFKKMYVWCSTIFYFVPQLWPTDQTTDKNKDHKRYITNQFTGHLYYIDFFLQKNNFSINLMVAIAVCTRWVFRHVCFVFNGHANGTSDHHRVDHRGKRTFFNQCLVTVHPTRNISRGWHHADSAVGLVEKK